MTKYKPQTVRPETNGKNLEKQKNFDYDSFWKSLIDRFFWNLIQMALPALYAAADTNGKYEFLDTQFLDVLNTGDPELLNSPYFADYVIKIPMKDGREEYLILHCEIQGRGGITDFPTRMHHYRCLIFAHHMREPVALAIITDKRPAKEALSYEYSHFGTKTTYEYNSVVVMDLDAESLLSSDNPIALAFYAAQTALKTKEELQRYNFLRTLAKLLTERGWSMEDKRDLLLFIERILYLKDKTLKKQYWEYRTKLGKEGKIVYEHFLRDVEEEMAEQRGMEKGREEGMIEVARKMLARQVPVSDIVDFTGLGKEDVLLLQ